LDRVAAAAGHPRPVPAATDAAEREQMTYRGFLPDWQRVVDDARGLPNSPGSAARLLSSDQSSDHEHSETACDRRRGAPETDRPRLLTHERPDGAATSLVGRNASVGRTIACSACALVTKSPVEAIPVMYPPAEIDRPPDRTMNPQAVRLPRTRPTARPGQLQPRPARRLSLTDQIRTSAPMAAATPRTPTGSPRTRPP
jgi:hypothetical protein